MQPAIVAAACHNAAMHAVLKMIEAQSGETITCEFRQPEDYVVKTIRKPRKQRDSTETQSGRPGRVMSAAESEALAARRWGAK